MVAQASLLVGGPGTAKTSIINQFMGRFTPEETTSKTITFSSLTTPAIFQTAVEVHSLNEHLVWNSPNVHPVSMPTLRIIFKCLAFVQLKLVGE